MGPLTWSWLSRASRAIHGDWRARPRQVVDGTAETVPVAQGFDVARPRGQSLLLPGRLLASLAAPQRVDRNHRTEPEGDAAKTARWLKGPRWAVSRDLRGSARKSASRGWREATSAGDTEAAGSTDEAWGAASLCSSQPPCVDVPAASLA